jgi:hypothetical protein
VGTVARLAFALGAVVAVALLAALLEPAWAADLGLDRDIVWVCCRSQFNPPDYSAPPEGFHKFAARLDEKVGIAGDLLDERLSLFEAAALFRRADEGGPGPALSAGDTEEEFFCRQVICWAQAIASQRSPGSGDVVAARLEEELQRNRETNGSVILPSCPVGRAPVR